MGLRSVSVGADTFQYYEKYFSYAINGINSEPAYELLNNIFSNAGIPWQLFLLLISGYIAFCIIVFCKAFSPDLPFSILLYMTTGIFALNMSGLRQSIAISTCLLAFIALVKYKKFFSFIVLVVISALFHNSALVFVLILLPYKVNNRSIWAKGIACLVLLAICGLFRTQLIDLLMTFAPARYRLGQYDVYSGYSLNPVVLGMQAAPLILYFLSIGFADSSSTRRGESEDTIWWMSLLCVSFYILSYSSASVGRLAFYFQMANAVLIPSSVANFSDRKLRYLLTLCISVLSVLAFFVSMPGGSSHIDNYQFFWS